MVDPLRVVEFAVSAACKAYGLVQKAAEVDENCAQLLPRLQGIRALVEFIRDELGSDGAVPGAVQEALESMKDVLERVQADMQPICKLAQKSGFGSKMKRVVRSAEHCEIVSSSRTRLSEAMQQLTVALEAAQLWRSKVQSERVHADLMRLRLNMDAAAVRAGRDMGDIKSLLLEMNSSVDHRLRSLDVTLAELAELLQCTAPQGGDIDELQQEVQRLRERQQDKEALMLEQILGALSLGGLHGASAPEVPDHLLCPITMLLMTDPVMLVASGITYEREAIERWLQEHDTCPVTGAALHGDHMLRENFSIRRLLPRVAPTGAQPAPACATASSLEELRQVLAGGASVVDLAGRTLRPRLAAGAGHDVLLAHAGQVLRNGCLVLPAGCALRVSAAGRGAGLQGVEVRSSPTTVQTEEPWLEGVEGLQAPRRSLVVVGERGVLDMRGCTVRVDGVRLNALHVGAAASANVLGGALSGGALGCAVLVEGLANVEDAALRSSRHGLVVIGENAAAAARRCNAGACRGHGFVAAAAGTLTVHASSADSKDGCGFLAHGGGLLRLEGECCAAASGGQREAVGFAAVGRGSMTMVGSGCTAQGMRVGFLAADGGCLEVAEGCPAAGSRACLWHEAGVSEGQSVMVVAVRCGLEASGGWAGCWAVEQLPQWVAAMRMASHAGGDQPALLSSWLLDLRSLVLFRPLKEIERARVEMAEHAWRSVSATAFAFEYFERQVSPMYAHTLAALQELDLQDIDGESPAPALEVLGSLTALRCLVAPRGCAPSHAPLGWLGKLTSLRCLHLSGTELTENLQGLGNLAALQVLHLERSATLAEPPECLRNLASLQCLLGGWFRGCAALPEWVGSLTALQILNLEYWNSPLAALPVSLGNLTALRRLNLRSCGQLAALPESLGNLTALEMLLLRRCGRLAALPESLGNLTMLKVLDLRDCYQLAALPESLGNLAMLEILDLQSCEQLAALPESLGNLTALKILHLDGCYQLGALPQSLEHLTCLHGSSEAWASWHYDSDED